MDEIAIDQGRSGEPGKVSGLEPIILIGPPSPILHENYRAARWGRWSLAFALGNAPGQTATNVAKQARRRRSGDGIVGRVRPSREPQRGWRGPRGRKPGICLTVVAIVSRLSVNWARLGTDGFLGR